MFVGVGLINRILKKDRICIVSFKFEQFFLRMNILKTKFLFQRLTESSLKIYEYSK